MDCKGTTKKRNMQELLKFLLTLRQKTLICYEKKVHCSSI